MSASMCLGFRSVLCLGCLLPAAGAADDRPLNVIVIMADDLGAKELACYGHATHRTVRTRRRPQLHVHVLVEGQSDSIHAQFSRWG